MNVFITFAMSGFWKSVLAVLLMVPLVLDGLIYTLASYSFKIFQLMCSVNFNSIYGIVQPLVDRLQAVVIVFVVYLLGVNFIQYMLNPDKALEGGKKFLRNLFIATALFVSYNFIFGVFNELNIALMGNAFEYKYTYLSEIVDLTDEEDKIGVITRFVFGKTPPDDPGFTIAQGVLGNFIRDHNQTTHRELDYQVVSGEGGVAKKSFWNIINFDFAKKAVGDDRKIDYTFIISFVVGCFVVYIMFSSALQVGIRMFKLMILQLVAPIIIVDVIKNGFEGKFKKFAEKYIHIFLEAFVRMLTILVITSFVCQFITHIGDYFPTLSSEQNVFTRIIITIIIIIAAYLFAGKAPQFIDDILDTHLHESIKGNFMGGLLGGLGGAITGAIGGAAAGGLSGALTGLGSGFASGVRGGSKGEHVADLFKSNKDSLNKGIEAGARRRELNANIKDNKASGFQRLFGAGAGYAIGQSSGLTDAHNARIDAEKAELEREWKKQFKAEHNGEGYDDYMERLRNDNQQLAYTDAAVEEELRNSTFEYNGQQYAWNANDEDLVATDANYQQWSTRADSLSDERKSMFESGASQAELDAKDAEIAEANRQKALAHQAALNEIDTIRNERRDATAAANGTTAEGRRQQQMANNRDMSAAQNDKYNNLDKKTSDLDKQKVK